MPSRGAWTSLPSTAGTVPVVPVPPANVQRCVRTSMAAQRDGEAGADSELNDPSYQLRLRQVPHRKRTSKAEPARPQKTRPAPTQTNDSEPNDLARRIFEDNVNLHERLNQLGDAP